MKKAQEFQLIYLFSKKPIEFNDSRIQLADIRLAFQKDLVDPREIIDITQYSDPLSKDLEDLALLSGVYSRFSTDQRLQNGEYEKLYRLWVKKAQDKNSVLQAPNLSGMVTFSIQEKEGIIGLIAVSKMNQGKGWGRKLIQAAEFQCFNLGVTTMKIQTQSDNSPACRLYESLGYTCTDKVYVYHYWK